MQLFPGREYRPIAPLCCVFWVVLKGWNKVQLEAEGGTQEELAEGRGRRIATAASSPTTARLSLSQPLQDIEGTVKAQPCPRGAQSFLQVDVENRQ